MRVEYLIPRLKSVFVPGRTLFIDSMPDSVTSGVIVLPSLVGGRINPYTPDFRSSDQVQIVARDTSRVKARNMAQQASDALVIATPETIVGASLDDPIAGDIEVLALRALSDPIVYPRPQTNYWEVSVNFLVHWRKVS